MQRYFIYSAYDGTNYCGWQVQPNGISIQSRLEDALGTLLREKTAVTGAGRTDSGVHAKLMTAHFDAIINDPDETFTEKLNRILPEDISILKLRKVKEDSHARFDAVSRTYKYYITNKKDPFNKNYVWRIRHALDTDKMNEAAATLFDYTDFTSFSKLHTDVKTNNCKIMRAEWQKKDDIYIFTIQADRFLRNMVRAIVGTLYEIGRHKIRIDQFREIIEQKDRRKAGTSVPAHGLFLTNVEYPENYFT